jgi:GTPase SAR1 family protein
MRDTGAGERTSKGHENGLDREVLFIIGPPGSGKSTLLKKLIKESPTKPEGGRIGTLPTIVFKRETGDIHILGKIEAMDSPHPFSDTVKFNAQKEFFEELDSTKAPPKIILEGQRLGNLKAMKHAHTLGYTVIVLYLEGTNKSKRRRQRAKDAGVKEQNKTWVKGAKTRSVNAFRGWIEFCKTSQRAGAIYRVEINVKDLCANSLSAKHLSEA